MVMTRSRNGSRSPSHAGSPVCHGGSPVRRGASPVRRGASPVRRGASPVRRGGGDDDRSPPPSITLRNRMVGCKHHPLLLSPIRLP